MSGAAVNTTDDKIDLLLRERKLLEQQLEEAHLHLLDVKSSWCAQNLSLETQVDRLSRQVAAEANEKHSALQTQNDLAKQLNLVAYQLEKAQSHIKKKEENVGTVEPN